jgi:protease II
VIGLHQTVSTEKIVADANDPELKFRVVLPRERNHEYEIEDFGNEWVIRTNWQAKNFRIVRVPMSRVADRTAWRDVIAHRSDGFVHGFSVFKNFLAVSDRSGGLLKIRIKAWAQDGTSIPVSIVYRKGFQRNGTAALLQRGYGSYGSSSDAGFSSPDLSLLDRGVVLAIAHIRGGQEMGRGWYEDGKLFKKKNTFTDFIDVTDFLVANRYAAKDRVAAVGGSAGGLLMGAIMNLAGESTAQSSRTCRLSMSSRRCSTPRFR